MPLIRWTWRPRAISTGTRHDDASTALAEQARVHNRMIERSRGPDGSQRSHVMAYADQAGATEAHALFGPPQEIIAGL